MVDPDMQALVIDNNSYKIQIGFSGDDAPRAKIRSLVGKPKNENSLRQLNLKSGDIVYGDGVRNFSNLVDSTELFPFNEAPNWDHLEKLYHKLLYYELKVTPEEHPVFLTDFPYMDQEIQEKLTRMMFELFNVPAMYIINQSVLNIFATGRITSLNVDFDYDTTKITPIYDGQPIHHQVTHMVDNQTGKGIGGRAVTERLIQLLSKRRREIDWTSFTMEPVLEKFKESLCYVNRSLKKNEQTEIFETLDGQKIRITGKDERFEAPEVLFQPNLMNSEIVGVPNFIAEVVRGCNDTILKKELCQNIVLSGNYSLFEGMQTRLSGELLNLLRGNLVNVSHPKDEIDCLAWIGGSIASSLSTFQTKWFTKDDFDEYGSVITKRICLNSLLHTPRKVEGSFIRQLPLPKKVEVNEIKVEVNENEKEEAKKNDDDPNLPNEKERSLYDFLKKRNQERYFPNFKKDGMMLDDLEFVESDDDLADYIPNKLQRSRDLKKHFANDDDEVLVC